MIESFLYGTCVGGQLLYWLFLRPQTHLQGALYWEALQLRLGRNVMQGE